MSGLWSGSLDLSLSNTGLWSGLTGLSSNNGLWGSITYNPSLNLDFLTNTTLDPRITFSRTTNATLVDATGRVTYAPNNLVLYSEQFDNAAWSKSASTITPNAAAAPNGTTTADKLVENTAVTTGHFITPAVAPSTAAGQFFIYSVYAKAGERTFLQLIATAIGPASANLIAGFDLTNGTAGTPSATLTSIITPAGDGWYRCSIAIPVATTAVSSLQIRLSLNSTSTPSSYTGDGTSGLFIWGAQFEQVTYQTLPSTYVQTVASAYYGPRFDYNPVTLAPRGLLIEEQRVNLALYSDQFDNASWSKAAGSVTANSVTSPDGTTNADTFVADTSTTFHTLSYYAPASGAAGVSYTTTVYLKAAANTFFRVQNDASGFGSQGGQFDLTAVTASAVSSATAASITSVGNGWFRCSVTSTSTGAFTAVGLKIFPTNAGGNGSIAGTGTASFFVWGAQTELGSFATSYIPTVASTVTRAADVATMTGTNFSSWYNASEGTIVFSGDSVRPASLSPGTRLFQFDNATTANVIRTQGQSTLTVFDASVLQAIIASTPLILYDGTVFKFASAYKLDDFATVTTGAVATDTSGTVPTVTQLTLGNGAGGAFINGHLRTFTFYPSRLTNVQMQELAAPPLVASLSLDFVNGSYQG